MSELVRLDVSDGIGTIRLDRPPMNAINRELTAQLREAACAAAARADVRAVVLYGGPKVFAAGADIKEMAPLGYADMLDVASDLQAALDAVAAIPKPVVAAVTGFALGGGCELALCADFRVAGDNAKFGQPEILLGVIPGAGGTQRLPRLVGTSRAKDLIFTGRFVASEEALSIGLVDQVVAPDDVYTAAVAMMSRYVDGPAYAVRAAKEAIDRGVEGSLEAGLQLERTLFAALFATEDQKAGMSSFLEQGPGKAKFAGR